MEINSELDRLLKYSEIDKELQRAERIHPFFPKNIFHQLAIMQEEAGEVAKAVNDCSSGKASIEDVRAELIQTAAMCMRMLNNLDEDQKPINETKKQNVKY